MPATPTILWHDYETTGVDPRRDRPMQLACLRTSLDLEPLAEPLVLHCRLADDVVPDPDACLLTGLTPARIEACALAEVELMRRALAELGRPATCGAGYNSLRFDDEVTRFALWRSLLPVYDREWRDGSSRWDLLDPMRAAYALRPDGIEWPQHPTGEPSFRLEDLAAANGIEHAAHDALADVRATVELARLLRRAQPRLYAYLFENRTKQKAASLLRPGDPEPVVHVSGRFAAALGCTSLVLPVCRHPRIDNRVIVVDLRHDPEPLLSLPVSELARLLFTPRTDLEEGAPRIGVKEVQLNRCPVLAPASVLDDRAAERIALDRAACERHAETVRGAKRLRERLESLYGAERPDDELDPDPDLALYAGFPGDRDLERCRQVHRAPPGELAGLGLESKFDDWRLAELLFRFRARNHPETLDAGEAQRWREHCRGRLLGEGAGKPSRITQVLARIAVLRVERHGQPAAVAILDELEALARERIAQLEAG